QLSWSGRLQRMRESVFGYAAKSGSGLGPAVTNLLGGLPVWVAGLRIEIYGAGDATRVGCRSAQILADKILYRANRIFGAPGTLLALRSFPFCRDLGLFLFRWLFRDHHGPVGLVTGLLVADDDDPDNVGLGLQQVRIVARRGLPHAERLRPCLGAGRYVFGRHARTPARQPGGRR